MWVLSNKGGDRTIIFKGEDIRETHDDKLRKVRGLHLKNQNIGILEHWIKAKLWRQEVRH